MTLLGTAFRLAAEVHEHQTDKADAPYMLHCIAVMQMVAPDEDAMVVALLHDSVEDCDDPVERLKLRFNLEKTFPGYIVQAINTMTHTKDESYDEYIERVAGNHLARTVKIADLTHNMDPRRIPAYQIVDKDYQRWEKYRRALIRLERGA